MNVIFRIEALAKRAEQAVPPEIDVVDRVSRTIRLRQDAEPALLDGPTLAFAGLSLAVTCAAALWFLPVLTTLFDPWTAYMSTPWSL